MRQETIEFEGFTFTVINNSLGEPELHQDAKGYFGAKWLPVTELNEDKIELLNIANKKFNTKFVIRNGYIVQDN